MCCHHGHSDLTSGHGRHFILRWVLGLIALFMVFAVGVKIGEFKEEIKSGFYGSPMMNWNYDNSNNGYYGMPMMRYFYQNIPQNQQQPAPQTKTSPRAQ